MEEILIANLTLDTFQRNKIPPLIVPQGDYGARVIRARITDYGKPVTVGRTAAVSIVAERSGDGQAQAFSGRVNTDGTVTVPVTQWMLDVPEDDVTCHVVVTGRGYQYSTTSFLIEPQAKANPTEITPDDPRVDVVTEVLANENTRQAAEATRVSNENARKTAENARQSAETQRLTDEATRVANEVERVSAESSRDATFKGWANDIASLPSFDARISANADRITNLESGIPSSLWEVDDTTARVKDVPTNARPKAIINKIGGMSYKCTVPEGEDGYFTGLRDAKVTAVKSVGVNLFDKKTIEINQGLGKDGNTYNIQGKCYSDAIAVQEGSIYSISNIDWYNFYYNAEKPSNNNFILQSSTKLVTVPNGAKYIRLSMEMGKIDIAMLNRGANAIPYTPYVEHILPIPEAVQALDGWGQGIPGTECCNFLDWRPEDGVRAWHHIKDRHIFDGSEVWKKGIDDYVFLSDIRILPSIPKSKGDVWNTHNYEVELSNNNIVIKTTMTADEFAAELATLYEAGTPFIVEYEREAPEVTDISDHLPADNLISVDGGGTLTFENEHGYDMPNTVTYMLKEVTS